MCMRAYVCVCVRVGAYYYVNACVSQAKVWFCVTRTPPKIRWHEIPFFSFQRHEIFFSRTCSGMALFSHASAVGTDPILARFNCSCLRAYFRKWSVVKSGPSTTGSARNLHLQRVWNKTASRPPCFLWELDGGFAPINSFEKQGGLE